MFEELLVKRDPFSQGIFGAVAFLDERIKELNELKENEAYKENPVGWMVEKLGIPLETIQWSILPDYVQHKWDADEDPIWTAINALRPSICKHAAIESATGVGKTFFAAAVVLWFLACFRDSKVFTLAGKEEQMRTGLWAEIGKLWPRFEEMFPSAKLTDLRIRMDGRDSWSAVGYSVASRAGEEVSGNIRGQHAQHMLHVFEEANIIPRPVWEAVWNTQTARHNLIFAIWNPDSVNDTAHQFKIRHPGVQGVRISGYDHPNVVTKNDDLIPGAVTAKSLADRKLKYGEDNPIFMSRGRGLCPVQGANALIKLEYLYAARDKFLDEKIRKEMEEGDYALGIDVANSETGDKAAIARGKGRVCYEIVDFQCPDASILGSEVFLEIKEHNINVDRVGVDGVGVGSSTVNKLKELGALVQNLQGGEENTGDSAHYTSLRAQMYWQLAQDLKNGIIAIPDDVDLFAELMIPKWTLGDKIKVESKEEIKKRLGHSPNKSDALAYWNWVRVQRIIEQKKKKGGIRFVSL